MALRRVAALFIDPRGPYPKLAGVDCWDESRDARAYEGPWPVVAHPPCGPWGRLAHMTRPPERRASDADCARYAVDAVQAFGGVLEQPAGSRMFDVFELPKPGEPIDIHGGRTIEVCQVEWSHPARKRTWLYLVNVPVHALEMPPFPGRAPTHWVSGGRGREGKKRNTTPVPPGIKVCSAQQRRRTPPLFAEYLVRLARAVRV